MRGYSRLSALMLGAATLSAWSAVPTRMDAGATTRLSDGTVLVGVIGKTVEVQPLSADIFRVTTVPDGESPRYEKSQSAVMKPEKGISATTFTTPEWVKIITPTTVVTVDRISGKVSFSDASGRVLLTEASGVVNASRADGGSVKRVSFDGTDGGRYYGGGERGHSLTLNGDSLVMYNRQNYGYTEGDPRISQMGINVPWYVSDKGYGVLFDDYNSASLELGADSIVYRSDTPKALSYYFVNSPSGDLAGATSGYADLTGHQSLPPFWALGYITSKYGYGNQAETLGVVDTLKSRGYPLDGIVLDLYWYGVETDMGRLAWDTVKWPDHKGMLRDLRSKGVNLVTISQPYINKKGAIDNYNYLSEHSMLVTDADGNTHDVNTWVGEAGMFDMSNPKTREWLWNRLQGLTEEGIEGWWGDLGEPEVHPLSILHANGESASQYHNVYGNEWSRLIYEGMRKHFPERRPLLLMRGGTAGLQRYSVFPWTTDVSRSWGGLQPQVKLMLSAGLSGLGYMSSDIGGFAVDPQHPTDPELYVRWLQMGAFTPTLRTHAQLKPEPYHYPAQEDILKSYIRMRYEWLPYNYTLAYENARYGYPMARPLNFRGDNPGEKYSGVEDEYLWGDNVLVAPVMKAGARRRTVTFPAGEWISWWNPSKRYKGGDAARPAVVEAPLDMLPLFVRAGSFIPQCEDKIENVGEYKPTRLTVRYYPSSEETEYTMFMDDRSNPVSLEENDYQLTVFKGQQKGGQINVSVNSEGSYKGMSEVRMLTLEIPGYGASAPYSVVVDGQKLERFDTPKQIRQYGYTLVAPEGAARTSGQAKTLVVKLPISSSRPSSIEISK